MDRHIKIIATLGPATSTKEAVRELVEAGARIFRLNFSHGGREYFEKMVRIVRELDKEIGMTLTVLQDLSGPKIRTCDVGVGTMTVDKGDTLFMGVPGKEAECDGKNFICLNLPDVIRGLEVGDTVALSDGMLRFSVVSRMDELMVQLRAETAGIAPPRKGVAFPGRSTQLAALTDKDKADLAVGMELDVDVVAMSYVQTPDDIRDLKAEMRRLGRELPVIAKLERPKAVENLWRILEEADGIMVARGDLGLECDLAGLPAMQKRIINSCNIAGKPVIVATQMLLSMVSNPMPTRAETTDVANAILDGADCIMLSEETAIGQFPAETVRFMRKIAYQAEEFYYENKEVAAHPPGQHEQPSKFLAYAAALLADRTRARAIVCHSTSGSTTRVLSSSRPRQSIYALSPNDKVRRFTNISWGVIPATPDVTEPNHQERTEKFVRDFPEFLRGEVFIVTAGQPKGSQMETQTNVVKVYEK